MAKRLCAVRFLLPSSFQVSSTSLRYSILIFNWLHVTALRHRSAPKQLSTISMLASPSDEPPSQSHLGSQAATSFDSISPSDEPANAAGMIKLANSRTDNHEPQQSMCWASARARGWRSRKGPQSSDQKPATSMNCLIASFLSPPSSFKLLVIIVTSRSSYISKKRGGNATL